MIFSPSVIIFAVSANAIAFKVAAPTPRSEDTFALLQGRTPLPTAKAELFHRLRKRAAESAEQLGFGGPDNTCGYLDGSLGTLGPLPAGKRVKADSLQERPKLVAARQPALWSLLAQVVLLVVLVMVTSGP